MANTRPRLLDLLCSQGGAGWGYFTAGFDVTGVDIRTGARRGVKTPYRHHDPVRDVRRMLREIGTPYVIENVGGAPLLPGAAMLCGAMFGLRMYRHRLFETSFAVEVPEHPEHTVPVAKDGPGCEAGGVPECRRDFTG